MSTNDLIYNAHHNGTVEILEAFQDNFKALFGNSFVNPLHPNVASERTILYRNIDMAYAWHAQLEKFEPAFEALKGLFGIQKRYLSLLQKKKIDAIQEPINTVTKPPVPSSSSPSPKILRTIKTQTEGKIIENMT